MSRFLNEQYQALEAYTPGEQPQDMRYIKLNTNESPYPPAPSVVSSITGLCSRISAMAFTRSLETCMASSRRKFR